MTQANSGPVGHLSYLGLMGLTQVDWTSNRPWRKLFSLTVRPWLIWLRTLRSAQQNVEHEQGD